jgi:putative membrane protein
MGDQESNRIRRTVGWGIIGLIAVIGLSIALSIYFASWRTASFNYPFFFFPFHFGWLGGLFLIIIVLLIAKWFFWSWRRGRYYSYPHQQRPDAASIVKERYAKGEITKEQYEQILRDLRQES